MAGFSHFCFLSFILISCLTPPFPNTNNINHCAWNGLTLYVVYNCFGNRANVKSFQTQCCKLLALSHQKLILREVGYLWMERGYDTYGLYMKIRELHIFHIKFDVRCRWRCRHLQISKQCFIETSMCGCSFF